jgi:hypothetical protein
MLDPSHWSREAYRGRGKRTSLRSPARQEVDAAAGDFITPWIEAWQLERVS